MEVYNVGGILISKDEMNVKCNAGIYLVKVDGKVLDPANYEAKEGDTS